MPQYIVAGEAKGIPPSVETLIDSFCAAAGEDAVLLLMIRTSFDPAYANELVTRAAADERIRLVASDYFPESDFQYFLNSADVVVLPFSEVLTSGSAIAALSFGKPLIVPRRGCLPELVDGTIAILYDPAERDSLPAAMARARELNWDGIAEQIAAVYRVG